jgi:hypothetical protein
MHTNQETNIAEAARTFETVTAQFNRTAQKLLDHWETVKDQTAGTGAEGFTPLVNALPEQFNTLLKAASDLRDRTALQAQLRREEAQAKRRAEQEEEARLKRAAAYRAQEAEEEARKERRRQGYLD